MPLTLQTSIAFLLSCSILQAKEPVANSVEDKLNQACSVAAASVIQVETDGASRRLGVVLSPDGLILAGTTAGRPDGPQTVVFADGRKIPAKCLGWSEERNIALLRVDTSLAGEFSFATISDAAAAQTGQLCFVPNLGESRRVGHCIQSSIRLDRVERVGQGWFTTTRDVENRKGFGAGVFDLAGQLIGMTTYQNAKLRESHTDAAGIRELIIALGENESLEAATIRFSELTVDPIPFEAINLNAASNTSARIRHETDSAAVGPTSSRGTRRELASQNSLECRCKVPSRRAISESGSVIAIFNESWELGRNEFKLVFAAWPDGCVFWSHDSTNGGAPFRYGRIDSASVTQLIERVAAVGYFNNENLRQARFGPDSSFTTIAIRHRGRELEMRSWHELCETSEQLVATPAISGLETESRIDVLANADRDWLHYRMAWAELRCLISTLTPSEYSIVQGQLTTNKCMPASDYRKKVSH